MGIHPAGLVERLVREGLARLADADEVGSVESRIYSAAEQVRRWSQVRDELITIATGYIQRGRDLGPFHTLCEASGWDAQEILALAKERAIMPLGAQDRLSPAVKEALAFLAELQPGKGYPASLILNTARERSISEFVLRKAKALLGIRSRRGPQGWIWEIPEVDG